VSPKKCLAPFFDEQSDKELILKYGVAKPGPSDVEIKLKVGEENNVEITGGLTSQSTGPDLAPEERR